MNVVLTLVLAVQMLSAVGMIGLVLLQHGKGADMGAAFGSGSSGSLFGASGSANFLSRATAVLAGVFFVCTLLLAYFSHAAWRRRVAAACWTAPPRARVGNGFPAGQCGFGSGSGPDPLGRRARRAAACRCAGRCRHPGSTCFARGPDPHQVIN
jgi:preprotein translocase subunit SecG